MGGRPDVVGQTLEINGNSFTIVGVAEEGFTGTVLGNESSVFVPLSMRSAVTRGFHWFRRPSELLGVYLFGRLKPGVTIGQAHRSAINGIVQADTG